MRLLSLCEGNRRRLLEEEEEEEEEEKKTNILDRTINTKLRWRDFIHRKRRCCNTIEIQTQILHRFLIH